MSKDEYTAPTVEKKSIMLTCVIDAILDWDAATSNTPGAFMQEDTKGETMHRKLEGNMVNMLTKLDPNLYRKYIHTKGNNPIVYVELKKALYGTLQADLMF